MVNENRIKRIEEQRWDTLLTMCTPRTFPSPSVISNPLQNGLYIVLSLPSPSTASSTVAKLSSTYRTLLLLIIGWGNDVLEF